jgi:hypothetical protein
MVNETLCKLIAHNLCRLIMSQIELGIEPVFNGPAKSPEVRIEQQTATTAAPVSDFDFSDFRFSD